MCSFAATLSHRPNFSCLLWGSSRRVGQIDDTHPKKSIERYTSQWWNCETSNRNLRFLEAGGRGEGQGCLYCHGTSPSELTSLIKPSIFHSMRRVQLLKAVVLASFIHPIFGNVRPSSDCLAASHFVSFFLPSNHFIQSACWTEAIQSKDSTSCASVPINL